MPITFAVMIVVSLRPGAGCRRDVGRVMVRLHAPEALAEELRALDRSAR